MQYFKKQLPAHAGPMCIDEDNNKTGNFIESDNKKEKNFAEEDMLCKENEHERENESKIQREKLHRVFQ